MAQIQKQQLDDAQASFKKALALDPKLVTAHFGLGHVYQTQKANDKAVEAYTKVLEFAPNHVGASNNLAWILADQQRDLNRAALLAKKALERAPKDGRIMDTLGWVYYQQGKLDDAEAQFKQASEMLPKEAAVQYHLGLVAYKKGRKVEASSAFKRALLLNANFEEAASARKLIQELGG
jgi:Tfp pilus assembly protein PilF